MRKKIILILPLLLFAITQQLQAVTCNWGYCNSVVNDQFGSVNKGKGAIYIPAEISKMYEGKQLSYVRVGLAAKAKTVKVFVTKDLNGEYITTRTQRDQLSGFNEIKFAEPRTIDGEGFYIGYEFESDDYALGASTMYNENACWADLGDGWKNYAVEDHALALSIQGQDQRRRPAEGLLALLLQRHPCRGWQAFQHQLLHPQHGHRHRTPLPGGL